MFAIERTKRALGISLGEHALSVAELVFDPAPARVTRTADFVYPTGVNLEQGETLGAHLARMLEKHGFTARHAIVGVPAKWLIFKPHELPPADVQTASEMLWLQATASIRPELGPMVFDYAGRPNEAQASTVLLTGMQRQWLDRVQLLADGANLKLLAVTPAGSALASTSNHGGSALLSLRREVAELVIRDAVGTRSIRHIGATSPVEPLISHLRRAAQMPLGENGRALLLWDEVGLPPLVLESLQKAAGASLERGELHSFGVDVNGSAAQPPAASAIALALSVQRGRRPEIDFLHPAISPPRAEHPAWRTAGVTAAGVIVLIAAAIAIFDSVTLRREVGRTDAQLATFEPALKTARPFVAAMSSVESFQSGNPRYLACLRDLTLALPTDGQTTFTSFKLDTNMNGEIAGRSNSDRGALALLDAMSTGKRFVNLNRKLDSRLAPSAPGAASPVGAGGQVPPGAEPGGTGPSSGPPAANPAPATSEVAFRLTFTYLPDAK